jgi:inward rectifier potassium channel
VADARKGDAEAGAQGGSSAGRDRPRYVDPQGRARFRVLGLERRVLGDAYHNLVRVSWPRLIGVISVAYLAANALFACGYWLDRGGVENAVPGSYRDAFFFSIQTMATIGYGKMAPASLFAHVLVTFQALVGVLGVAMITGLMFAKFSLPTARVMWSNQVVVSKRNGVQSLMFRAANQRSNQIVEATMRLVLARNELTSEGEPVRRFHDLELARSSNAIFALTWTVVHPITEKSPLYGQTSESLAADRVELIAALVGLDGTLSQTVHARHSWTAPEIRWDHRFVDLFSLGPNGQPQIDYAHFHDIEPIPPP